MTDGTQEHLEKHDRRIGENAGNIAALLSRVNELEDRVADMEGVVNPDPGSTAYKQLTKDQKVHRVRKTLVEDAAKGNGAATMKYNAVRMLFDGHPSPGHCYDLMERAGEMDGFVYDTAGNGSGNKRVRVVLNDVNDEALIHAANNATTETPA